MIEQIEKYGEKLFADPIAQTPLVRNLPNPEYMKILLDGKTSIEELFAEIEITRLRQELKKAQQNPEKIPAKIKRIIDEPKYPEKLAKYSQKIRFPAKI